MPPTRRVKEDKRGLVLAIDIGTTFSAVSYCIHQPGVPPRFNQVVRWPKQAEADAKIPSVIFYNNQRTPQALGAETQDEDTLITAEEQGWYKAEWWKLQLRPRHLSAKEPLPSHVHTIPHDLAVQDIYADFLVYVLETTKNYFISNNGDGQAIWEALSPSMNIVMTTPNSFEGPEQAIMRKAAVDAGIVPEEDGARIRFVTEAEAALHYMAKQENVAHWIVPNSNVIVCDAGGGTIDITGYKISSRKSKSHNIVLSESGPAQCQFAGSVYVNASAEEYLRNHLRGTEWAGERQLRAILEYFEIAKKKFTIADPQCYITLSIQSGTNDPALGIKMGRLKLSQETMRSFFQHSLDKIKEGLETFEKSGQIPKVILVGGLSGSPYLYSSLVEWGQGRFEICRPDPEHLAKVVPHGGLSWHLDCVVASRVVKTTLGTNVQFPFDKHDADHRKYAAHKFLEIDHDYYLDGGWHLIAAKNAKIEPNKPFVASFTAVMAETSTDFEREENIYAFRSPGKPPTFMFTPGPNRPYDSEGKASPRPGFELIAKVHADIREAFEASPSRRETATGKWIRKVEFDIILHLSSTEVSARLRWQKKGSRKLKEGPATIVYI